MGWLYILPVQIRANGHTPCNALFVLVQRSLWYSARFTGGRQPASRVGKRKQPPAQLHTRAASTAAFALRTSVSAVDGPWPNKLSKRIGSSESVEVAHSCAARARERNEPSSSVTHRPRRSKRTGLDVAVRSGGPTGGDSALLHVLMACAAPLTAPPLSTAPAARKGSTGGAQRVERGRTSAPQGSAGDAFASPRHRRDVPSRAHACAQRSAGGAARRCKAPVQSAQTAWAGATHPKISWRPIAPCAQARRLDAGAT
jgi:hypothetical protein